MTGLINRILIVDDELQIRSLLNRSLKKLWPHLQIAQAEDGFQAVTVAKEFLPQLVILDLMLPGQDGFSVLEAMSQEPKLQSTLVLGITGYNSPENIRNMIAKGAFSCLTKPFGPEDLRRELSPYLGKDSIESMKISSTTRVHASEKGKNKSSLLNVTALMSLMMASFAMRQSSEAASTRWTKNTQIEEPYKKEEVAKIQKVAVMPFESSNLYIAGKSFADTLVGYIVKKVKNLTVIERPDIEKILSEQKFVLTGAVKQRSKKEPGGIETVDALIMGTVRTMEYFGDDGGSIVVTVKVVDVNDGEILWAHKQEARCYSIGIDRKALAEELMNRAAKKIAKEMDSNLLSKNRKTA